MSDSTTQKKSQTTVLIDDSMSKFEKDLLKKVRNKQKKIKEIEELEKKVKKKEIVANQEQQDKISSKKSVQAEIDEVNGYVALYKESQKGAQDSEAKLQKQFAKDLTKSQTASVRTFANILTLHMLKQSGQKIPEEMEEGVKHFSDIIDKFTGKSTSDAVNWRQDRDVLITNFKKLVTQSKDLIEDTDISYEDLNTGVAESISSNDFPELISFGPKAEPEPVKEAAKPDPVPEEKKEEPEAKKPAPADDDSFEMFDPDFGAAFDAEPEKPEPETKEEETPAEKTEAATEGEGDDKNEDGKRGGRRGGRGRGKGDKSWRGEEGEEGKRGGYRGRGERGRGGRGNWRGRNNGVDAEGFETVKASGDRDNRGRGRGRGRGDRGGWRGADGEERRGGDRPRTFGRGRGERPPRRGAGEKVDGDLPGVATATTKPDENKE